MRHSRKRKELPTPLPCPFCGKDFDPVPEHKGVRYSAPLRRVVCGGMPICCWGPNRKTQRGAINAWNKLGG